MQVLLLALTLAGAVVADGGMCPPKHDDPCFSEQAAVCRDKSLNSRRLERDEQALEACRRAPPAPSPTRNKKLPPWRQP